MTRATIYQEDDYVASKDNVVKCGASAQELARLVHVMADESTEEALQQLVTCYKTRQVLDDKNGRIVPWKVFVGLFNDAEFAPTNHFIDDDNNVDRLREIDPSSIKLEVDDKKLKGNEPNILEVTDFCCICDAGWWLACKAVITKPNKSYHSSGRMGSGSEVAKWKFCNGNMGT